MPTRKNLITFHTDQQRADSLGCMGNPAARTPNLDALAQHGVLYRRHYSVNPVCTPSRAAYITGRYLQANRVLDNGIPLPESEVTLPEVCRQNGYRTASIGKLHLQPWCSYEGDRSLESHGRWARGEFKDWHGPYYGYEYVEFALGHGEQPGGHCGQWRAQQFPNLQLGPKYAQGDDSYPQWACWRSNLPLAAHPSTWVADRAIAYLDQVGDAPFCLNVSFPDPHHPFTPPAPYHSMFDDVELPPPHAVSGENEAKPGPWRAGMTGDPFPHDGGARFFPDMTPAAYRRIVAHTYGMVALIDACVGRVLAHLAARGLSDRTVIVFTSDHGDFLGDHHFVFKGQAPCRSLLHIPLLIADPDCPPGVVDAVGSNVDVMPTLLQRCGLSIPEGVQGVILPAPGEAPRRDHAYEAGWSKASPNWHHHTIYTADWRLSIFPNLRDGELYDLQADPWEHRNLFHDPGYARQRAELMERLAYAIGAAEPAKPPVLTYW